MKDRFKYKVIDTTTNKIYANMNDLSKEEQNAHFLLTQDGRIIKKYYNNDNLMLVEMSIYKPLFCTGLKDKNGKLIFEGDIVRVDENLFEIVYEIGSFMIATKTNCASIHQFKGYWNDNVYPLSQLYFEYENEEFTIDNLEIIGNIYENPELLEGEK